MFQQSLCVPLFYDENDAFDDFCRQIAEIGYKGVELWAGGEEFAEKSAAAAKHDMLVVSFPGHASLEDGLNNPDNHDRIESELRSAVDAAAKAKCPNVIAFTGNRIAGQSDMDGLVQTARGLNPIAPYAAEKGVTIVLELLNSKIDHFNYLADHSDFGYALCELADSPAVKLLFDIYHMQITEGDLIRDIRRGIDCIGHFHTAGNPGRTDLDDDQELNYRGICRAIAAAGYEGFVGHEFAPKGDKIQAARAAFELCNVQQ